MGRNPPPFQCDWGTRGKGSGHQCEGYCDPEQKLCSVLKATGNGLETQKWCDPEGGGEQGEEGKTGRDGARAVAMGMGRRQTEGCSDGKTSRRTGA